MRTKPNYFTEHVLTRIISRDPPIAQTPPFPKDTTATERELILWGLLLAKAGKRVALYTTRQINKARIGKLVTDLIAHLATTDRAETWSCGSVLHKLGGGGFCTVWSEHQPTAGSRIDVAITLPDVDDEAPSQNACEHCDEGTPAGKRFCSDACTVCESAPNPASEDDGCAELCQKPTHNPAAVLDAIPLGSPTEERERAKVWMRDAASFLNNAEYWRGRAKLAERVAAALNDMHGLPPSDGKDRPIQIVPADDLKTVLENAASSAKDGGR